MADAGHELLARVRATFGESARPDPGPMASWDVFPFEEESLRVRMLSEYARPEPDRRASPEDCKTCVVAADSERVLGSFGRFRVIWVPTSLVFVANVVTADHVTLDDLTGEDHAEMGRALGATYDAVKALDDVGQVHLNKWENGKGHFSFTVLARPAGVLQLRGSNLPFWADMLPPTPIEQLAERAEKVRAALAS